MIFDTHAHYDDEQFDEDRDRLILSLKENGIGRVMDVGASLESVRAAVLLAKQYPHVYAAVGIHPDNAKTMTEAVLEELYKLTAEDKVRAVGEIGLDYYWDASDRELQKLWFRRQLELAKACGLPVIIHSRDAAADTFDILKKEGGGLTGGVIHCYSGSAELAREYCKMGFYLGIGGVVTFKNAKVIKEVVKEIPLEQLVLETDCPYLAPVPFRGKRNSSLYLPYVAEAIAQIKETDPETVIRVTEENACRLYRLEESDG